jgi:hypothetical protein
VKKMADIQSKMRAFLREEFIIQLLFGCLMVIFPVIMMVVYGFNVSLLTTVISGGLLIVWTFRYLRLRADKDISSKIASRLYEAFIIQLAFGVLMLLVPVITMILYGFNFNLLMTAISGGLLIFYSIRTLIMKGNLTARL